MFKMNQIVNSEELLASLGDGTSQLEMRVGLHSGKVTAGVLRGEKARFQLFGDTVNTASRMESNGQKGRIQVSQSTADCLVAAGKNKWLTSREDLVEAKGKGKMQTYWVTVGAEKSLRTSSTDCEHLDDSGLNPNAFPSRRSSTTSRTIESSGYNTDAENAFLHRTPGAIESSDYITDAENAFLPTTPRRIESSDYISEAEQAFPPTTSRAGESTGYITDVEV